MKTKRKLIPKSYPFTEDGNAVSSDVGHRVYDGNMPVSLKKQCLDGPSHISSLAIDVRSYGVRNMTNINGHVVPNTDIRQPISILHQRDKLPHTGNYPSVVAISAQPEYVVSNSNNRPWGRRRRTKQNPPVTGGTSSEQPPSSGPPLEFKYLDNDNRLSYYGGDNNVLRRDIVEGLIDLLDTHNALEYELPTGDMLGAIVYEPGPESDMNYDIILEERSGHPQRVNKLHPSYMSLQFPLLFIYGEDGYSIDLKMNRIDFIREHQNDIRNEYLSGIYDAIKRGDNDGSNCGSKLILPQSFTSGPRYMYSHYLDALAIYRVHGNPSYFITFTCNVNWPEISEYMVQFPLLTTTDRADIVDRVFEMKINQFINYLRDNEPFGKVIAGCTSFPGIRTVNNIVYPTCRSACEALGLLQDDQEREVTLQEVALTATPAVLRALLAHI
ncbi:DNA helicase, partial [Tanacetum coccineum]